MVSGQILQSAWKSKRSRTIYHRSQLIIATHSPVLLARPPARINRFSEDGIHEIKFTDTEHCQITRDFLNRRERMLELLLTQAVI